MPGTLGRGKYLLYLMSIVAYFSHSPRNKLFGYNEPRKVQCRLAHPIVYTNRCREDQLRHTNQLSEPGGSLH